LAQSERSVRDSFGPFLFGFPDDSLSVDVGAFLSAMPFDTVAGRKSISCSFDLYDEDSPRVLFASTPLIGSSASDFSGHFESDEKSEDPGGVPWPPRVSFDASLFDKDCVPLFSTGIGPAWAESFSTVSSDKHDRSSFVTQTLDISVVFLSVESDPKDLR